MEEPTIRHVRFFNTQFLREDEFREEQQYLNHMRRRLNYALFTDGVVEITSQDLTIVRDPDTATGANPKRIRVRAGMAVGGNSTVKETKEIILRRDSDPVDLSTMFGGGTVWVTVNYLRTEVIIGGLTQPSRVDESAELRYHGSRPASGATAPNGEPLIIIGSVTYADMSIAYDDRQYARLRAPLLAVEPSIRLDPASVTAGTTGFETTIRAENFNLAGITASSITFPNPAGITPIPPTIVSGPTTSNVRIRFNVASSQPAGTRMVRVTLAGGAFEEAPLTISAFVPAPTVTAWPGSATRNTPLTIVGTNFTGTVTVTFAAIGGGTVVAPATVNPAETQLTINVPGAADYGFITVTAAGGSVTSPAEVVVF
jgi:hypothetical protein